MSVGDAWLRSLAHRDTRLRHLLHLALVASSAFLLYGVLFGCTAIEKGALNSRWFTFTEIICALEEFYRSGSPILDSTACYLGIPIAKFAL